jgi:hypothetical protein
VTRNRCCDEILWRRIDLAGERPGRAGTVQLPGLWGVIRLSEWAKTPDGVRIIATMR